MERRVLVYVAGPYRAPTEALVAVNVHRAAAEAAELLYGHGYAVICPHSMSYGWERHEAYSDEETLLHCLEVVTRCDAVLMLLGWEISAGSLREKALAEELGIPVYLARKDLLRGTPPDGSTITRHWAHGG